MKKYIGKIYDGRWKVIAKEKKHIYILENIYNKNIETITYSTLLKIEKGQTNVSRVIYYKVLSKGKTHKW